MLSPTSVLGEIIGKLERDSINKLLKGRNIINASQHSSVQNKPCQTNLLLFFDEISSQVAKGNDVGIIHFNFCVPFDLVSFNILIKNIALHNINKACFNWIKNWLTNMHKKVISKGLASERGALQSCSTQYFPQ